MTHGLQFLQDTAEHIAGEDCRYTTYPVWEVQHKVRRYGIDRDYTEQTVWLDRDNESEEVDAHRARRLDILDDAGRTVPSRYERVGYVDEWETVVSFFTEPAADAFIEHQRHNLHKEVRTYVNSLYRHPEGREIRRLLSGPMRDAVLALKDAADELRQLHDRHYPLCEGGCTTAAILKQADQALEAIETGGVDQ